MTEFTEFLLLADAARVKYPAWRRGQTLFNVLHDVRPDLSERVRATELDPFHDDSRIPAFFTWVRRNWVASGQTISAQTVHGVQVVLPAQAEG